MKMNKACETGEVREVWHEMAGCDHCGTCVRWDLQDHPVFGWQTCREKTQPEVLAHPVVSPRPQPEVKTPLCPQCQRPMTWTATAPVVGARMEWRCFHHADLGTVDGCEVIEVDADGHVSRPVKGPLREGPLAHPVVSPRTEENR